MTRYFCFVLLCLVALRANAFMAPKVAFSQRLMSLRAEGAEASAVTTESPAADFSIGDVVDTVPSVPSEVDQLPGGDPMADKILMTPGGMDLDTIALVTGQENYGLAVVALAEAVYSFLQAPTLANALVLVPGILSAIILGAVSGPMLFSGDSASVELGLGIATLVSVGLGVSYVLRLLAPYSPAPKEIAFLGLLVSIAGFFSFSQNLVVDGFITLPALPSIPMPSVNLPSIDLPF